MGRAPCCEKNGLKKGPWTPEEDQKLIDYIHKRGYGNWRTLPKNAGLQRCGKSCRLRWTNYLRPDIKRGRFSFEEEETIIQLHSILGNKWSAIASRLPGRTDNEIKNYWNTHVRKRLLRMGIDPVTHSPRLDLLDLSSILSSSLYASSQANHLQRLLGVNQPPMAVNPELLKLASSLFSSPQQQQQIKHLDCNIDQIQNHPQFLQFQDNHPLQQFNNLPLTEPQLLDLDPNGNPSNNLTDHTLYQQQYWDTNNGLISRSTLAEDYNNIPQLMSSYNDYYHSSNQNNALDPSLSEAANSTFQSNNSNQNFSLASVMSTPSSSPTSTHDERELSYRSICNNNMLRFEIPDVLDVTEFM